MKLTNEERSFIYNWFRNMLGKELSLEQLNALQAGTFSPFFAFMQELGFEQEVAKFQTEVTACQLMEFPHLELAADYAQLFLLEGNLSALPYASAYLSESVQVLHFQRMDQLLSEFKLQPNKTENEPADHLCMYLEIMDKLITQGDELKQQQFITEQYLAWLPQFVQRVNQVPLPRAFYPVLSRWLLNFVEFDLKQLSM